MNGYRECFYTAADGLRLFYRDYPGPEGRLPVLCIPGLTRNARDFDFIAAHIAKTRRVLCADLRGRGRSEYDPEWRHYAVPVETADMLSLLAAAGVPKTVPLGTSRGGIVAMAMASAAPAMLGGAVLNDIGAEIGAQGLLRILEFLGREPAHADWDAAAGSLKRAYASVFPGVPDQRWQVFAHAIFRESEAGIVPDYDRNLGEAMRQTGSTGLAQGANVNLWPLFAALTPLPALVIHGENSDLLSAETLLKMKAAKPDLDAVTVKNRGHVPFLDEAEAVAAIDAFLARVA